jgi:Lon protease-like protein
VTASEVFIFPLQTVLFPGGTLPLKVFEQRYVEMTKICLRDSRPFGVCLIREGHEVGTPALPEPVGCLATIRNWEMPHPGMFMLEAEGQQRFRILDQQAAKNGLISARIETIEAEPAAVADEATCVDLLKTIISRIGGQHFPAPHRLDDAVWVGYRLAEVLPLPMRVKQELLELGDSHIRLQRIRALLEASRA